MSQSLRALGTPPPPAVLPALLDVQRTAIGLVRPLRPARPRHDPDDCSSPGQPEHVGWPNATPPAYPPVYNSWGWPTTTARRANTTGIILAIVAAMVVVAALFVPRLIADVESYKMFLDQTPR